MSAGLPHLGCPDGGVCRNPRLGLGASPLQAATLATVQKLAQRVWVTASPASVVRPDPLKFLLF